MGNFAKIGKATLAQALGIQVNHKENQTVVKEIETQIVTTECSACYCYLLSNNENKSCFSKECANCPHHKTEILKNETMEKVYINEKSSLGKKSRLSKNAIKVLLYLHFCNPDKYGLIQSFTIAEMQNKLDITTRTAKKALKSLQDFGYIVYAPNRNRNQNCLVILNDYKSYSLKANEGGRGYITIEKKSFFERIFKIDNITTLVIELRSILFCNDTKNIIHEYSAKKSFSDIKKCVPKHNSLKKIKKIMKNLKSAIVSPSERENEFSMSLKDEMNGRKHYEYAVDDMKFEIKEHISAINNLSCNKKHKYHDNERINKLKEFGAFGLNWRNNHISLNAYEIENLAKLAVEYNIELVKTAISNIISKFVFAAKPKIIQSWGATTRMTIREILKFT